jgi:hypothetical protein
MQNNADRIRAVVASKVSPVAIHPTTSGEYAENPVSLFSKTIKYWSIILNLPV